MLLSLQVFKRGVKYRATRAPETTAVNQEMVRIALAQRALAKPGVDRLLLKVQGGRSMGNPEEYDSTREAEWLSGRLQNETHNAHLVRHSPAFDACCFSECLVLTLSGA